MIQCAAKIPRRKRIHRQGFTLIEITAVVIVLAIIAVLALPNLQSRDDLDLSAAARIVVADLLYAQSQAIATGNWQYVAFRTASTNSDGAYSLYDNDSLSTPITHPISQLAYTTTFGANSPGPLLTVGLTGLAFSDPSYSVLVFNSLGAPSVCPMTNTGSPTALISNATITLESGSMSVMISIEPDTGNITVSPVAAH